MARGMRISIYTNCVVPFRDICHFLSSVIHITCTGHIPAITFEIMKTRHAYLCAQSLYEKIKPPPLSDCKSGKSTASLSCRRTYPDNGQIRISTTSLPLPTCSCRRKALTPAWRRLKTCSCGWDRRTTPKNRSV